MFDCFKSKSNYNKVDDQSLISNEITISKDYKDIQTAVENHLSPAKKPQRLSDKAIKWYKESFISAGSIRGTIFILCASAMGPSTTTIPVVFNHNGIVAGIVLLFLGGLFSGLYYQIMFKSALKSKTNTYYDCIVYYFDRKLGIVVQIFVILLTFSIYTANQVMGCTIWYSFFHSLGISYFKDVDPPTNLLSVSTIIKLIQAVAILPLCLKRKLNAMRYLTFFVVLIQIYVMGLIIGAYPTYAPVKQQAPISYSYFSFNLELLITFTIFLFIYSAQPQIYPLKKEMKQPSLAKTSKVITRSISMMFIIFCIIGIFGYLTFGSSIKQYSMYIQIQMTGSLGVALKIALVLLGILVYLGLPLNLNPGRAGIVVLIKGKDDSENLSTTHHFLYTIGYMLVSLAIVIFYPKILSILSLAGGLVVGTIGILIPGLLYLKMSEKPWTHWWNLIVIIFSIILTLVGYAGSLASVIYKG